MSEEKSAVLEQLHKLKVAAEYSVLLSKLNLCNWISQFFKEIPPEDVVDFCKENNIPYTEPDKVEYQVPIKVYVPDDINKDKFKQAVGIITCPRLDILPDNDSIDSDNNYIIASEFDTIYEKICDRLNEIDDEYNEIAEVFQGE